MKLGERPRSLEGKPNIKMYIMTRDDILRQGQGQNKENISILPNFMPVPFFLKKYEIRLKSENYSEV